MHRPCRVKSVTLTISDKRCFTLLEMTFFEKDVPMARHLYSPLKTFFRTSCAIPLLCLTLGAPAGAMFQPTDDDLSSSASASASASTPTTSIHRVLAPPTKYLIQTQGSRPDSTLMIDDVKGVKVIWIWPSFVGSKEVKSKEVGSKEVRPKETLK